MRGEITVTVKRNDFGKAAREYPKLTSQVVRKTGFDIIRLAAPFTPVDTGFLRMAVTVVTFSELMVAVYWAAEYAIFQELGTRYIPGKFFATQAAEAARQPYIDAIKAINLL